MSEVEAALQARIRELEEQLKRSSEEGALLKQLLHDSHVSIEKMEEYMRQIARLTSDDKTAGLLNTLAGKARVYSS